MLKKLLLIPLVLFFVGCNEKPEPIEETPEVYITEGLKIRSLRDFKYEKTEERMERGKYLTESVLQCFLCHTEREWSKPGAPLIEAKKGGGAIYNKEKDYLMIAPNITPDIETGAGTWTDDMIGRAVREGIGHDGRALSGAMWYWALSALSDEDLASVVVYLRSIPPVKNKLPKRKISKELQQSIIEEPLPIYEPVPTPDLKNKIERGKYLVKIADCTGCHDAGEAPFNPGLFGGGNLIKRLRISAFSSNISFDQSGISYDENTFIQIIRTGKSETLRGAMPWIVFRNMTDEDLKAIYAYLKTFNPVRHYINNLSPPAYCKACGQKHGLGELNVEKKIETIKVNPEIYRSYNGDYTFDDGWTITIADSAKKLFLSGWRENPVELLPVAVDEFAAKELWSTIRFRRDKSKKVTQLLILDPDDNIAKRISE